MCSLRFGKYFIKNSRCINLTSLALVAEKLVHSFTIKNLVATIVDLVGSEKERKRMYGEGGGEE